MGGALLSRSSQGSGYARSPAQSSLTKENSAAKRVASSWPKGLVAALKQNEPEMAVPRKLE